MDQLAKLAYVIAQLATYAGAKKTLAGSTLVLCPYHNEATPSFRIFHSPATKSPGYGKCYGCGASHKWDEFADKLGLKPIAYSKPTEMFTSSLRIKEDVEQEELKFFELPENKTWRGIKTNFLREVGAKRCVTQWGTSFVYLPVMARQRLRGYVKARMRKEEDKPSYINSKGSWSQDAGLFLYDYAVREQPSYVVLVEGPRDGLRLNYLGIPTMSILGTQSWSAKKSRLLELSGVTTVVLCMDGDDAGIAADTKITEHLTSFVKVRTFSLHGKDSPYYAFRNEDEPSKAAKAKGVTLWDPGNMPLRKVRELKAFVEQLA